MANAAHIERLKQSVKEWMQRQYDIPHREYDLSGVDLSFANLSKANFRDSDLSNVNFSETDFRNADFSGADFNCADFHSANLRDTNLSHANLSGADLNSANLSGANMSGVFLNGANLSGTHLKGTNLRDAVLGYTIFTKVDLRSVKGLVTIHHTGPSIVELYSIRLPQDGSALHFLRGVGIPNEWIDFYRSTMMQPIQYYSCFIGYSSADEQIVTRLHADLQANGIWCWFAPHDLKPGNYMLQEINNAIYVQDKLILILSEHAMKSGWIAHEVELAQLREIRQQREILFPIRLDNAIFQSTDAWAMTLRDARHIGDFTNWTNPQNYQHIFDRLLRDLKKADEP